MRKNRITHLIPDFWVSTQTYLFAFLVFIVFSLPALAADHPYFKIRVIDDATGRGVPLVELRTVNEICYYTDSNGIVAFYEPGLMNMDVFFFVGSHGYSFPKNGFGMQGTRLRPTEGGETILRLKRENLAERLYRITGAGIYRDSILTNEPVPLENPVLNGQVMGQDSTMTILYQDKIYWFWGDTNRPQYPLGNFEMSGATSKLPGKGGLPPEKGIDLKYFMNAEGFCKPMSPFEEEGMLWLDGFMVLPDESGEERLVGHYNRMKSLGEKLAHGLVLYDDSAEEFKELLRFDLNKPWQSPHTHPIRLADKGQDYFYFPVPYPTVRVRADLDSIKDQSKYEAFTCLQEGTKFDGANSIVDRIDGRLNYAWKKNTDPMNPQKESELLKAGLLQPEETRFLARDIQDGTPVIMHSASVRWNDYRKKWIMIGVEIGGTSVLGEVWYAESGELTGPWQKAQKIVTHDQYSFYNPVHHPFFDQEGGRLIYFEGTYTKMFSGNPTATPRYDYNQIMYRLNLDDIVFTEEPRE